MKIVGTESVDKTGFKKKVLKFGKRERNKNNLNKEYEVITNMYGGWLNKLGKELVIKLNYNECEFKIEPEYNDDLKMSVIGLIDQEGNEEIFEIKDDSKSKIEKKGTYKIYKNAIIQAVNNNDNNEENNKEDNDEYKDVSNKTKEELINDTKRIARELGHEEVIEDLEIIQFNDRLKSVYGKAYWRRIDEDSEKEYYKIEINPTVPIDEYQDTIAHELAHAITKADDHEQEFIEFCVKNDISRHGSVSLKSAEDYKYKTYCTECGKLTRKYKRLAGAAKNPDRYQSGCCDADIEVEKL